MADAKFVIVDGNSLFYILKAIGIGKVKDQVLFEILTKEIGGEGQCFGRPVLVLWSNEVKNNTTRMKYLEKVVGYEIVDVEKKIGGEDDQEIVKWIEALSPEDVSKIILVSCDVMDFLPCLRTKMSQGIKVWLVATKKVNSEGKSMLTSRLDLSSEGIEFVELGEYKDRIMREPWVDRPRKEKPPSHDVPKDVLFEEEGVEPSVVSPAVKPAANRIINLSLEVAEEDFDEAVTAIAFILKMPIFPKSTLEVR